MPELDNPAVNRCLKDKAIDHIDHALGRPAWPLRESYRNYFACDPDGEHARSFMASPHWERGGRIDSLVYFRVTDAGRKALADHLAARRLDRVYVVQFDSFESQVPAATRAKARYSYWLTISESWPDLTFGAFARRARVRRAA